MNAPLIVAHGDLLLPTIYPLSGTPLASYGEEWTLAAARPALNEYEIPFYAAHFLTAYISPAFHSDRFPYTPVSLWGKLKRSDLIAEQALPEHIAPPPPAEEPAPFAFEPFTAPEKRPVPAPTANYNGRKQLAGGAIALACAAFIAWTLFGTKIGTKIGRPVAEPSNETVALSATPVAKPMGAENVPVAASAAAVAIAPAPASAPRQANDSTIKLALADQPKPTPRADSVRPSTSTTSTASNRAKKSIVAEQTSATRTGKTHVKPKATARGKRDEHRYAAAQRPHGGYLDQPTYRTAGRDEPLTPGGRRTSTRGESRGNGYLSPAEMYSMLAHSPILDDNSSAARESSGRLAAPIKPMTVSRVDSAGAQGWIGRLSQQRVTDAPSQFAK